MNTIISMINCCFSQINVERVEDLDSICEELLGMPLLLRVWAEHTQTNEYASSDVKWEGNLFNIMFLNPFTWNYLNST